jgi:hypothetical protein
VRLLVVVAVVAVEVALPSLVVVGAAVPTFLAVAVAAVAAAVLPSLVAVAVEAELRTLQEVGVGVQAQMTAS